MNADRWQQIKQIVADALELDREVRGSFVASQCAGDDGLRREVETLLAGDVPDSNFLALDRTPERIGPYRVVREIGRGGMGTVYLAERDDGQFQQRVAVKVIKRGMDTDAVLSRFYAERQILARLQHPNITRLLDGGMFDARPYFVMEYLEGRPIVEYCREHALSVPARIGLFLQVCAAVEHAHRNLILHRDIKAGNILVDSGGVPKLLDFGIAKLLEEDGATEQTVLGLRALTPQSASPEQLRGEPLTTASDVYSLGLLLFELLVGKPPERPIASAPRELRGDLGNVTLKALEEDPARRYQGPGELAADLSRHLQGLPVTARPGGPFYRAGKFVSRNRRMLTVAAVALLALGIAVGSAIREGRRANRQFQDVRQMANSFLFEFHDAIANLPGATPARELVVRRALQYLSRLESQSAGDPGLKRELAQSYLRIGTVQGTPFDNNLGRPADARASIERSVSLFEEVRRARPSDPTATADLAEAQLRLSSLLQGLAGPAESMKWNRKTAAMLDQEARKGPLGANAEICLGLAYFGISESEMQLNHLPESLQARLKSVEVLRDVTARFPAVEDGQRWLAQTEKRLAYLYLTQLHDPEKAAESLQIAMKIDQGRVARDPQNSVAKLDLALGQVYLAAVIRRQGDLPRALELLQQGIAARAAVLTADPRNFRVRYLLITDYTKLAGWQRDVHHTAESQAALEEGLRVAGEMDPRSAHQPDAAHAIEELKALAR
ncbi:MAG TPA: serine/threonine-protein kinase [Candidatus Sulfopaludibacter sp.]|nr:serine/threonine-protein kinase [Candidatus Sulfopaludibacter sp.]